MVVEASLIVASFFPKRSILKCHSIGKGHINDTLYCLLDDQSEWVLQRINTHIFPAPDKITRNVQRINAHLATTDYPYQLLQLQHNQEGQFLTRTKDDYWRVFPFFKDTYTIEAGLTIDQARQIATGFGSFAFYLNHFEVNTLETILPDFHAPYNRYQQLLNVKAVNTKRLHEAQPILDFLGNQAEFLKASNQLVCPLRVTHNDTKYNNILLANTSHTPVAIIDLDTLQPGYLVYDFGDLVRTACNPEAEDSRAFEKIIFQKDIYQALLKGFLQPLRSVITPEEQTNLQNGARWIILEQTIRFVMDYLQGDIYYKTSWPMQNWVRAKGQLCLYESMMQQMDSE